MNLYVIGAAVLAFAGAMSGAYLKGAADERADQEAAAAKARVDGLVGALNLSLELADIAVDGAAKLAAAEASGKTTVAYMKEKTHANPATPARDCRIDDGAFRVLVDAFLATGSTEGGAQGVPVDRPAGEKSSR